MTDPRARETRTHSSPLEFAVLLEQAQIAGANHELQRRGLLDPSPKVGARKRLIRRLHRQPDPASYLKTWDVQRTIDALVAQLDPSDAILDVGCFACDVLPALHRIGFTNLYGIDLNPAVLRMPHADAISYTVGDLMSTPWPDSHFAGITAISVIEHGVPDDALCREVSRLLRPGGLFIFTTDYWPQKIATNQSIFGLDWRIFDTSEIEALVDVARSHNLHPVSDPGRAIKNVQRPPIHYEGKDYTFLYGALIRGED